MRPRGSEGQGSPQGLNVTLSDTKLTFPWPQAADSPWLANAPRPGCRWEMHIICVKLSIKALAAFWLQIPFTLISFLRKIYTCDH